jgi:hypothetical protein
VNFANFLARQESAPPSLRTFANIRVRSLLVLKEQIRYETSAGGARPLVIGA